MASDVEMEGRKSSLTPDLHLSPPATASAATSRRSSLAAILNDDKPNTISVQNPAGSAQAPISIPVLVHSPSPAPSTSSNVDMAPPSQSHHGHSGASSSAAAAPPPPASPATQKPSSSSSKPVSSAKPRSTKPAKPARSPSPSPPPPLAPVPLQTIRLDIRLGGPLNYEVDISRQAKDTGQRPPTPPPVVKKVHDSSESEEEEDEKKGDKSKLKKRKKKNAAQEYYDTSDPFIDDSELALDERQYFAQTKQQGFYVSSGEVALLKDKTTPKKPKSKKISFASGLPPMMGTDKKITDGVKETPIQTDETNDSKRSAKLAGSGSVGAASAVGGSGESEAASAGQKRKRHNSIITEGGKRKKVVDEKMFHSELQAAVMEMRELVNKESWEHKGKFPPALKPHLAQLAILAIKLDEYDDDFFSLMPALFPYNKFTMTKLIKRTVFTDHLTLLTERQDMLLVQLAELATAGFAKAEEEWEKNVVAWDKRQEKTRAENADGSAGTPSAGPTRQATEEMDVDHPHSADGDAGGKDGKEGKDKDKDHSQHPPGKRYRMTEQMKSIVWELVLLSNECCRLENEKNSLEGSIIQISDQGLRKVLYQKIVAAFPEGWMSSGQISRDVSVIKKKLEKEAMELDADD